MARSSDRRVIAPTLSLTGVARLWLAGAGVFAVTILGAGLLVGAGYFVTGLVFAVLSGLVLIVIVFGLEGGDAGAWVVILGLCGVVIAVGAAIAGQDEVVLFGSNARDVVAAEASASRAAFLHFRDARVLADRIGYADVIGGTQHQGEHVLYRLKVAPIVDRDWTDTRPVGALAVIGSAQFGHHVAEWRQPLGGGIALNGVTRSERAKAAADLARFGHVTIAPDAVFVRWTADPAGEAATARGRLWSAWLIALVLWSAALLVTALVLRRRTVAAAHSRFH